MPGVKMRSLRKFRGVEGDIGPNQNFEVRDRYRADELESLGLAAPVEKQNYGATKGVQNKAAVRGPTSTGGGRTGATTAQSSSRPGPRPGSKPKGSASSKSKAGK